MTPLQGRIAPCAACGRFFSLPGSVKDFVHVASQRAAPGGRWAPSPAALRLAPPDGAELPRAHRTGATQLRSRFASCSLAGCAVAQAGRALGCAGVRWGLRRGLWLSLSGSPRRARIQGAVSSLRCGPHQPLECCARPVDALRLEPSSLVRAFGPRAEDRVGRLRRLACFSGRE